MRDGQHMGFGSREMMQATLFERDLLGVQAGAPITWTQAPHNPSTEATETIEAVDERVFIPDERVQVKAQARHPSTKLFPFNTICLLRGSEKVGTGTLIAPRVVLTARHNLRVMATAEVTPGADLSATSASDPRPASPNSQTTAEYRLHGSLDIGLVILPRDFTRPNEFMMLQPRSDRNTATLLTNAGYPGRRGAPPGWVRGTMWRHSDFISVSGVTPTHLMYRIDTSPGHSGSPLWLLGNDGIRLLLAVHVRGPAGDNEGVRITCAVIDWIEDECKAAGVRGPRIDRHAYRAACRPHQNREDL